MRTAQVFVSLAVCLWGVGFSGSALAGEPDVSVTILEPTGDVCVNNGGQIGTGGILGGEALPDRRPLPVTLQLHSAGGVPLLLTFTSDFELFTVQHNFLPGDEDAVVDLYSVAPGLLLDGEEVTLEVIAVSVDDPGLTARDEVSFQLDRSAPILDVETDLEQFDLCPVEAPEIVVTPRDFQDPAPTVESRVEVNGCRRRQIFTTRDACGNQQEYEYVSRVPPDPATIDAALQGYRCGVDRLCVTDGPNAVPFEDNDRVGRGTVVYDFDEPGGCIDFIRAVLIRAEDYVEVCPEAADLEVDEDGQVIEICPILEPGAAIEDAGDYVARLTVGSCGEEVLRDELAFTILERPTADPGGPYVVEQGDTVFLDASGSTAAPELGGIVAFAWDLNNDGFFDSAELGDDWNRNGQRDSWEVDRGNDGFDFNVDRDGDGVIDTGEVFLPIGGEIQIVELETEVDGLLEIELRVIAGNGAIAESEAIVDVQDVDPDCQMAGPFEGFEGVPVVLDASGSSIGHPSDPIIAWNWDFGDGVRPQRGDNLPMPAHVYGEAGEYTVTLRLEDIDSSSVCQAQVTVVEVLPVIEGLAVVDLDPTEGEEIRFTAGQTRPGSDSDPILEYAWTFGPGLAQSGESLREPRQVFEDNGVYEVCLLVRDEDSEVSDCIDVVVADLHPSVTFVAPAEAVEGEEVIFDARGTAAGGDADALVRLEWDFGDGEPPQSVQNLAAPGAFQMAHTFRQNGRYTVTLTAFDEDSQRSFQLEVAVGDTQPTAAVTVLYPAGRQSGVEGVPLEFDASASRAGADEIDSYRWNFGDGETMITDGPRVTHTYPDDGTYQVRVTVVDIDGSTASAELIAEIDNRAPEIEIVANETQVELGQLVQFRTVTNGAVPPSATPQIAVVVDDVAADLPPATVEWHFGDGSEPVTDNLSPTYRYAAVGEFIVRVVVIDEEGAEVEAEFELEVTPPAPRIEIVPEQTVAEGETLEFTVGVEAPPLGEGFATLAVNIPGAPAGAEVEVVATDVAGVEDPNGVNREVRVRWTPTYYQAGRYQFQVRASALEVARSDRTRSVTIQVTEAGTPRLAAVGGTPGRGVVRLFDYAPNQFRAVAEVEIGLGGGGLAAQPGGGRVFATVPGSNRVAVIKTTAPLPATPVRRIPVGRTPVAVAAGMNFMWVVNAGDSTLSIIDTESLKVARTVSLAPLNGPSDVVWLGPGFAGLDAPRLAVVSRRSGHVALVDPDRALAGQNPIAGQVRLGGVLTRVVADPVTGWLHIADAKSRRIYRIMAADVAAGDAAAADGVGIDFAPIDLAYLGETLYVAIATGLIEVSDDGTVAESATLVAAQSLATAGNQILAGGALVVASPTRIENLAPETLAPLTSEASSRVRRMATFVAQDD